MDTQPPNSNPGIFSSSPWWTMPIPTPALVNQHNSIFDPLYQDRDKVVLALLSNQSNPSRRDRDMITLESIRANRVIQEQRTLERNLRIDKFIGTIPRILRYAEYEKIPTNTTEMAPEFKELNTDSIRDILMASGNLSLLRLNSKLLAPISKELLEKRCFDGISKGEIISSLSFTQTTPGVRYDASFYILTDQTIIRRFISGLRISGTITFEENGLHCEFGSSKFIVERPELFIDALIKSYDLQWGNPRHKEKILCFFPLLESVKLFVSDRVSCSSLGNFPDLYYNMVLEAIHGISESHHQIAEGITSISNTLRYKDYFD
jgi:hypothetical protein